MTENLNKKPPKGILKSSSSFDTASCAGGRRNSGVGSATGGESSSGAGCSRQGSNELTVEFPAGAVVGGVVGGAECCAEGGTSGGEDGEGYVCVRKHSKTAKFDEMNILETYHPATKTYGHMKIEEPKTPFNYYEDEDDEAAAESSQSLSSKRRSKEINADELVRKLNECQEGPGEGVEEQVEEESSEEENEDDESRDSRVKFESKRKAHYNEYYAVKLARKLMEQEEDDDVERDCEDVERAPQKFIPEEEARVGDNGDRMVTDQDIEGAGK